MFIAVSGTDVDTANIAERSDKKHDNRIRKDGQHADYLVIQKILEMLQDQKSAISEYANAEIEQQDCF